MTEHTELPLPVGPAEVAEARATLRRYADGKAALTRRLVDDELWWELRHWETMRRDRRERGFADAAPEPSSAWLFNTLLNKHADVMDNLPEPVVLPREPGDAAAARTLTQVLPAVLEAADYYGAYAQQSWEKLKHGTAVYGVFWDPRRENGLGDIDVAGLDLLNVFWEPGIDDIQRSRNLFITELVDTDLLEQRYPEHAGRLGGASDPVEVKQYLHDEAVDLSGKSLVVDWYYKRARGGRTALHYVKFCGDCLLYASENDPALAERGFYDHGLYPVVFDALFPEKGSPAGFGYIAVTKDPQMYIDRLSANLLESAMMATKKRFFVSTSTNVNPEQFADWSRQIVPVEGELSQARIQEIRLDPISGVYMDLLRQKIAEMKDTAGNRDVNSGGVGSGVTAAAAIAALQEAGNKTSRDLIAASFRAHAKVGALCIELMRQFYDVGRAFRVTGAQGAWEFVDFDAAALRGAGEAEARADMASWAGGLPPADGGQTRREMPGASPRPTGETPQSLRASSPVRGASDSADLTSPNRGGAERSEAEGFHAALFRRPVFDLKIRAQKRNPFSVAEANERAKELYALGFFDPARADQAAAALEMMDFEGKDAVLARIREGAGR